MKIYIKENKLSLLKESQEEVTFFSFFNNIKQFLKELLNDPINAKPNEFLRKQGFNKSGLVKKLIDKGIITKKEDIKEVPNTMSEDSSEESVYSVQYNVPKKNFEKKIHRLYSKLYENEVIEEDGEGSVGGGGSISAGLGGATNSNISAAAMYDAPFGGVQRRKFYGDALKRNKDEDNGSISMNRLK